MEVSPPGGAPTGAVTRTFPAYHGWNQAQAFLVCVVVLAFGIELTAQTRPATVSSLPPAAVVPSPPDELAVLPTLPQLPAVPADMGKGETAPAGPVGPNQPSTGTDTGDGGVVSGPSWRLPPLLPVITVPAPATPGSPPAPKVNDPKKPVVAAVRPTPGTGNTPTPAAPVTPGGGTPTPVAPPEPPRPTSENPLKVSVALDRTSAEYSPAELVQVKVAASTDCYIALLRVDAQGNASLLYPRRLGRAARRGKSYAWAMKAGTEGWERVVVVASAQPLTGSDAAAALDATGPSGDTPAGAPAANPSQAGSALQSVLRAQGGDATFGQWARHDWACAQLTFHVKGKQAAGLLPAIFGVR